jgi:hypothetical protein
MGRTFKVRVTAIRQKFSRESQMTEHRITAEGFANPSQDDGISERAKGETEM